MLTYVGSLSQANEKVGDFVAGRKRKAVGDQGDIRGDIAEEHGNTHDGNWNEVAEGSAPFVSENKTREIVIALKRSGCTTMTAADAASCGYRSSLDIKKSDRDSFCLYSVAATRG